jgi:pimeloyl-ACP methyl ester carboxylesterase
MLAHGGSPEHGSARSTFLADRLRRSGLDARVIHLLSDREADDPDRRRDLRLLTRRMKDALEIQQPSAPVGVVAGGRVAQAALATAARSPDLVDALALLTPRLSEVAAASPPIDRPVLMAVGEYDMRGRADAASACRCLGDGACVRVVPMAGPHFEEAAALETLAEALASWFGTRFAEASKARGGASGVGDACAGRGL